MTAESFASRVQALRKAWVERRQVKALASSHEFEPQLQLLQTLHGWATQAVDDIRAVYGESLYVAATEPPNRSDAAPGFAIVVDEAYRVTFSLTERKRMGGSRWFVSVTLTSAGPGGGVVAAGPERRSGQWTRSRLEDLLLSALGAYERALSDGDAETLGQRYSTAGG